MDAAESSGALYGLENSGGWHHLSTPEDIKELEENHDRLCVSGT